MGKRIGPDGFPEYQGLWWKLALPQAILGIHLGVVALALIRAEQRSTHAWIALPAGLVSGWLLWTLFEYALHRWCLHHTRLPLPRRILWEAFHKEHHSYPGMQDPDHHGVHLAISLPTALLILGAVASLSAGGFALATVSGWLLGYCSYEALHWLFHGASQEGLAGSFSPLRRIWEAHTVHHLERASANYGFVTQFWDRRFGTSVCACGGSRGGRPAGGRGSPSSGPVRSIAGS